MVYSSVVVDEVDIASDAILKPENNSPIGSDGHSPEMLEIAPQRVKMKRRKVERANRLCFFENSKDLPNLSDMLGIDAPRVVFLEQLAQPSVPEVLDHCMYSLVKRYFTLSIVILQSVSP
jgi:hypothetical protein